MAKRLGALALLLMMTVCTASAEGALYFGGGAGDWVWAGDGKTRVDHLFGSSPAITPGELLEDSLYICPARDTALLLCCQNLPEVLGSLRLTVKNGEETLFDGPLSQAETVPLGSFSREKPCLLELYLQIPQDLPYEAFPAWQHQSWLLLAITPTPQTADQTHPTAAALTGALTGLALAVLTRRNTREKNKIST